MDKIEPDELEKLLEDIGGNPCITGQTEKLKLKVFNSIIARLIESINQNALSNEKLAKKVYCLNIILVILTGVMAVASIMNLLVQ